MVSLFTRIPWKRLLPGVLEFRDRCFGSRYFTCTTSPQHSRGRFLKSSIPTFFVPPGVPTLKYRMKSMIPHPRAAPPRSSKIFYRKYLIPQGPYQWGRLCFFFLKFVNFLPTISPVRPRGYPSTTQWILDFSSTCGVLHVVSSGYTTSRPIASNTEKAQKTYSAKYVLRVDTTHTL